MGAKKPRKSQSPDFERSLDQLEETVRRLEAGDLPLEESLAAFEKGVALVRTLHTRLDAVQTRIDELTQGSDGASLLKPMQDAPGSDDEPEAEDDEYEDEYDDDEDPDE